MKHIINRIDYTWDQMGYCTELVVITLIPNIDDYKGPAFEIGIRRMAVRKLEDIREEYSHPTSIGGQIDCTAKPFGSRWAKINVSATEEGIIVLYKHSWSIDI